VKIEAVEGSLADAGLTSDPTEATKTPGRGSDEPRRSPVQLKITTRRGRFYQRRDAQATGRKFAREDIPTPVNIHFGPSGNPVPLVSHRKCVLVRVGLTCATVHDTDARMR